MPSESTADRLVFLVKVFSLLAFCTLFFFGLVEILSYGNTLLGYVELLLAFAVALNVFALYVGTSATVAKNILILVVSIGLVIMQITGGIEHTGIFWFYVMPTSVFFLAGRRGGVFWTIVIFFLSIAVSVLGIYGIVDTPYSLVTIRQMLISLFVASVMVYAYEKRLEHETISSEEKTKELLELNKNLLAEAASRIEAEKQLEKRTSELERINGLLVGRELRMIELKKEIQKLEHVHDH